MMNRKIGIRHEDKYAMERRVPLTPKHIRKLIETQNLEFEVQASPKRIFRDDAFAQAGASVVQKLNAPVIMGVKEIPLDFFEEERTYVFFSHVIKGQSYNMPMLKNMMKLKCNLIDYEKIADSLGRRLIFFGRFAGLAGMINSLWSAGLRYKTFGISTPFEKIQQAHKYESLEDARKAISEVGFEIAKNGLPEELCPFVIGITGYGNVSNGAQEIANLLPVKEVSPEELLQIHKKGKLPKNLLYKVVFKEEDLSEPLDPDKEFDLQDYYDNPQDYKSKFEQFIPHLSILMNCMYWDDRYPRIVTKDYLEELYKYGNHKLTVIGDVTCDPDGSIECTHKGTEIEDPIFVYDPFKRDYKMGHEGTGILVMAVDILPSELPRESSIAFGDALFKYVESIATADYNVPFNILNLPEPVKMAVILHKGQLTPDYQYIEEYLK
ncbi:MAG: hypothetical protein K9G58_09955 [Bacteroidales bacterium]|nr:hypothetical protein [Bacteroidales bacterium]